MRIILWNIIQNHTTPHQIPLTTTTTHHEPPVNHLQTPQLYDPNNYKTFSTYYPVSNSVHQQVVQQSQQIIVQQNNDPVEHTRQHLQQFQLVLQPTTNA